MGANAGMSPRSRCDTSAHAFRLGGFGTHELVKYYDMVRELLRSCWNELTKLSLKRAIRHAENSIALISLTDFLERAKCRVWNEFATSGSILQIRNAIYVRRNRLSIENERDCRRLYSARMR